MAQKLTPYIENSKWGFKQNNSSKILAQYDTVFLFDKEQKIAMVGNTNKLITLINPLTGEESFSIEYSFINSNNQKIKLVNELKDTLLNFAAQEDLFLNYQYEENFFKILHDNRVYLFNKDGKQLSSGYDNIYPATEDPNFFIMELSVISMNDARTARGLVNSDGLIIVKCENKYIHINTADSVIYCCSAVFSSAPNDEVFNYYGKLIYSSNDHIAWGSKNTFVTKVYQPNEKYIIINLLKNAVLSVEGNNFCYVGNKKGVIANKNQWYLIDLVSLKKQNIDVALYYKTLDIIFN